MLWRRKKLRNSIQTANGMKCIIIFHFISNQICHHLIVSPYEIILFILVEPKMSPFDRVTIWNETDYSFQIEFVTIRTGHHLKLFQTGHHLDLKMRIFTFHIKHSYGDICHHMKTWSENFSYLSPKNPFIWWWSDQVYHSASQLIFLKYWYF